MKLWPTIIALFLLSPLWAQSEKPKLVVGIVVDQMRNDYLYRFAHDFGEDGFKKLLNEGYHFKNAHYNYVPTYTGPGHASIYTGTTPRFHGIIANNWYNRDLDRDIYCAEDSTQQAVGGSGENGAMSPANMFSTTISDQLRLTSNFRSKVIGVAIKDRGAILPAGHSANAAYWFDPVSGDFISSTYYMTELPRWVKTFNNKKWASNYLTKTWQTMKPIEDYKASHEDNNDFERSLGRKATPTFPYDLSKITGKEDYGIIRTTPFGNTLTLDMAIAAIEGESLGQDEFTDLLAVSFSSTDYVGHAFGPHSVEIQDTYMRLDREIARLLKYLDEHVGVGNYTVFLTADHGVVHVPSFLQSQKVQAGYYQIKETAIQLGTALNEEFGKGEWLLNASNDQLFINKDLVLEKDLELDDFQEKLVEIVLEVEGVLEAYSAIELVNNVYQGDITASLRNGYNMQRSGDVLAILKPNYLGDGYGSKGTTHGSGFNYDTHIPILFYGKNIKRGKSVRKVNIVDIAPTLSLMLDISLPNAATGLPLSELFE